MSDYFIIPLDLGLAEGAFKDTGIQNSIVLETTALTGSFKIYISTTNRLDILQLFQAIQTGQKIIAQALKRRQIERMVSHDIETFSGFLGIGKEKLSFRMTNQGVDITGGKSTLHYDLSKITSVSAKQNDQNYHNRIVLTVEENGHNITKEYNCPEHSAVLNTISCFLMNINLKQQQESQAQH